MPHQFTHSDGRDLKGIWWKNNGRRFCTWRFDADSATLKACRGVVVSSTSLDIGDKSREELQEELPYAALDLAKEIRPKAA